MRKIFAVCIFLLCLSSEASANASVVINGTAPKAVLNYIVGTWAQSRLNFRIESANEYGMTIIVTREQTQLFNTNTLINRKNYTAVSNGNDVILSLNETYSSMQPGGLRNQPIGSDGELYQLHGIKEYFNGRYYYGFTTGKKAKGGFTVTEIIDGGPAAEAGIKTGDILIAVNGIKVVGKDQKYEFGLLPDRFDPGPAKLLVIQDGEENEFIVTPKFRPGKNKTETPPVDTEKDHSLSSRTYPTKRTYSNGNVYEGYVVNGKAEGKGKFTWTNGDIYEGNFSNNEMNGKGMLTYANGDRYDGDFVNGKRQGMGILVFANGDRYEGQFLDNKIHGQGVLVSSNGERKEGSFANGEFIGKD